MAEINPTRRLFLVTRTPQCHWGSQPGGCKALQVKLIHLKEKKDKANSLPFQEILRIIKPEKTVIVLNIVLIQ
jgi:hypothetical protein